MSVEQDFQDKCGRLGISIEAHQLEILLRYCSELEQYNRNVNLVSNGDLAVVLRDHILDSLTLVPLIREHGGDAADKSLIDIGSGAGFPGVVLACYFDGLQVTLVESIAKKCAFLDRLIKVLGIDGRVIVINYRAEELARRPEFREQFDFATARAVGSIRLIAELAVPFLRRDGVLLAQRSAKQLQDERPAADKLFGRFGAKVVNCHYPDAQITEKNVGVLLAKKVAPVPQLYPRRGAKLGT